MLKQQPCLTNEQIITFFKLCENHDWYYQRSDDSYYFNKGDSEYKHLVNESRLYDVFQQIYNDYRNYMFLNSSKPLLENYLN
jgi:hypothetical protein